MNIIDDLIMPQFNTLKLGRIKTLTAIGQGVSQQCFHAVVVDNTLALSDVSNIESTPSAIDTLTASLTCHHYILKVYVDVKELTQLHEFKTYQALNNQWPYSAKFIAYTKNMLVLEKLVGVTLVSENDALPNNNFRDVDPTKKLTNKLHVTFNVMANIHQLSVKRFDFCQPINFTEIFKELLETATQVVSPALLSNQLLKTISGNITGLLEKQRCLLTKNHIDSVICHGDLNFGNIVVNNPLNHMQPDGEQHDGEVKLASVIDFESLCLMPPEYDIAMCLAVNEVASTSISHTIACYEKYLVLDRKLNTVLIENYYELSLYINGLWYLQQSLKTEKLSLDEVKAHRHKACSQFNLLTNRLVLNISE